MHIRRALYYKGFEHRLDHIGDALAGISEICMFRQYDLEILALGRHYEYTICMDGSRSQPAIEAKIDGKKFQIISAEAPSIVIRQS